MSTVILNGRTLDLTHALPLTLGDWKQLEKQGVYVKSLSDPKASEMITIFFHILHKVDKSVTVDEVEGLSFSDPVVIAIIDRINTVQELVDPPFSMSSTSSPQPTDGQNQT